MKKTERKKEIKVRYSDDEYLRAKENSQGAFAVWLRDLSLNQVKKKGRKIKPVNPELLYELNKIGVNLNQIAKVCNQASLFDSSDKLDLLLVLASIDEELKNIRADYDC